MSVPAGSKSTGTGKSSAAAPSHKGKKTSSAPPAATASTAHTKGKAHKYAAMGKDAELDALFQASLKAYEDEADAQASQKHFSADDDVIRLEDLSEQRAAKSAAGQPPHTARQSVVDTKGKARQLESHLDKLDSSDALDDLRDQGRRSAKRQRRELNAKTAGSKWYDLPAFPTEDDAKRSGPGAASSRYTNSARGPTAEEMRREVQAIRLRNALDPKRFYKGASKEKGMPKFAQLGRIISSPLEPKMKLTKAERGNSVVEELIKDAEASAYARRKFSEHQVKTSAGGRGHSKAKSKKPADRKRQRK